MKKVILLVVLILFPISVRAADYYTVSSARTQVRSILDESTASFWTNDEIDNWIQEAVEDISARAGCIQSSDDISLVTDQYEYTATDTPVNVSDMVDVTGIVYIVSTDIIGNDDQTFIGLQEIAAKDVFKLPLEAAGPPKYFYHHQGLIGVFPPPTTNENGQTLRVYYTSQSQTIGDLPNEYQPLTIWYAVSMAYRKEHRFVEANGMYQMYLEKLKSLSGRTSMVGKTK